jgi:hypothetical protein
VHGEMKLAQLKSMRFHRRVLERPLPDLLAVMCLCNRAHFERVRRSQRRVSEQRAIERESRELKVSAVSLQTKKFTVVYDFISFHFINCFFYFEF